MILKIGVANSNHNIYAEEICEMMAESARVRGTGIARREPEYIQRKMNNGNAVIALDNDKVIGFCYIEIWEDKKYVANSGLIIHPDYRAMGLAKKVKEEAFKLSRKKYPGVRLFGITTSLAVMKINSKLGYEPVTFSELTKDEAFWNGCASCRNFPILKENNRNNCLCTGMLYEPKEVRKKPVKKNKLEIFYRWVQQKQFTFLKGIKDSQLKIIKLKNQ